jgi:hypothetical protein
MQKSKYLFFLVLAYLYKRINNKEINEKYFIRKYAAVRNQKFN